MNKRHFIEVLKNPALLNEKTLDSIRETLEEYPFFQAGRMLWIKNLHQLDHIRYNNELKYAAAHVSDRARLFELIHSKAFSESMAPGDEQSSTTNENQELVQHRNKQKKIIETEHKDNPPDEVNYFQVDDVFTTPEGAKYDYSQSEFNSSEKERVLSKQELVDNQENIILPSGDLLEYEHSGKEIYQLPYAPTSTSINEARSFSDWLNLLKHDYSFAQPSEEQRIEKSEKKKKDLVDNFLQKGFGQRMKIESTVEETSKNIDISLSSVREHDDLMTETLANIYIKQKQFLKAIDVFERLRLKYPEKNIYFARRIENINDKINNQ